MLLLLLLLLGVLPSSGIIIIPRRYRPISSSSRLFREIVRRRVFSLRSIGVPHLFFGIGGRLSMKCLQPLLYSRGSLQILRREFSLFCPRPTKEEDKDHGLLNKKNTQQVRAPLSACVSVCFCSLLLRSERRCFLSLLFFSLPLSSTNLTRQKCYV